MIGVIDYGMGNLRSVEKAFEFLGFVVKIINQPRDLDHVTHAVLPGVGAFPDAMNNLNDRQWVAPLKKFTKANKPLLGICLGMQLLFEHSDEGGSQTQGLGLLPGHVSGFAGDAYGGGKLKVPHMGWNAITWQKNDPLMTGLEQGDYVYFVHGYHVRTPMDKGDRASESVVTCVSDYPQPICASVWQRRIWGVQFHPEKSQAVGLKMLKNFAAIHSTTQPT